jgi:hypothetical protein
MSEVIRFNYLHRDSGNWKKFGSKIFSNPEQLTIEEIEQGIQQNLIDSQYFYPEKVDIKKFKFHRYLDDYSWYEFESVEIFENIDLPTKELKSITNFLLLLRKMKKLDVYLIGDQPTTCPLCGARTKIKNDLLASPEKPQYHMCMAENCKYSFIVEEDN